MDRSTVCTSSNYDAVQCNVLFTLRCAVCVRWARRDLKLYLIIYQEDFEGKKNNKSQQATETFYRWKVK